MDTNPPPRTAEQINRPLTGQHSYTPDSIGVVLRDPDKAHYDFIKAELAKGNPVYLKKRLDELEFAIERIVNLLEHADPLYALQVAKKVMGKDE